VSRGAQAVLWGGTAVGVLDIAAAFALRGAYGAPPSRVLQGIASGLLGSAAYRGGVTTTALGLVLHFFIAYIAAAVYFQASRWWPILVRRAVVSGLAFGVVVHAVMNQLVLPLSRVSFKGSGPPPWQFTATMVVIHMLFVGLPIALAVRHFAAQPTAGLPDDDTRRTDAAPATRLRR
jgi:hypothetical protein